MPELKYAFTEDQMVETLQRALDVYWRLQGNGAIPSAIQPVLFQGALNMAGAVEQTQVTPGAILPRMDILRGH